MAGMTEGARVPPPAPPTVYAEPTPEAVVEAAARLADACQAWGRTEIGEGVVASESHGPLCNAITDGDVTTFAFWFGVVGGLLLGTLVVAPALRLLSKVLDRVLVDPVVHLIGSAIAAWRARG